MNPRLREGLRRWVDEGIPPGSFLRAVLQNDLLGAVTRADPESLAQLPEIVRYVYNELPEECWGSYAKYAAWFERLDKGWAARRGLWE